MRLPTNRLHLLSDLFLICVCGVVAGADGPQAIGAWAPEKDAGCGSISNCPMVSLRTLDVTFREDENRVRERWSADNLAWLKRFALSLLKQQTDKDSIAMRRRKAGWRVGYLMQVLGIKRI